MLIVVLICFKIPLVAACMFFSLPDFGGGGEEVEVVEVQEYVGDPAYGTATTQLHKVRVAAACNDLGHTTVPRVP